MIFIPNRKSFANFLSNDKVQNKPAMKIYPNPTNVGQVKIDSPEHGDISI